MSPTVVRRAALVLCAAGIAAMIVSGIAESTAGALTAGLIAGVAALTLIVVTAVTTTGPSPAGPSPVDESLAADVEDRITALVAAGADERMLRDLVGTAVRLGRRRQATGA